VWTRHTGSNQRWSIVYTDKAGPAPSKGLDSNFGFHIGRAFYLRSRMPMKRIAECVGTDVRLRRFHGRRVRQQTWRFDGKTKTIKSQYHRSYSMTIPNHGRNNQLRVTTTTSRWW
jgi:hypothetical protein